MLINIAEGIGHIFSAYRQMNIKEWAIVGVCFLIVMFVCSLCISGLTSYLIASRVEEHVSFAKIVEGGSEMHFGEKLMRFVPVCFIFGVIITGFMYSSHRREKTQETFKFWHRRWNIEN